MALGAPRHAAAARSIGGVGLAIVALLLVPAVQLNPAEAQAKDLAGRRRTTPWSACDALTAAGHLARGDEAVRRARRAAARRPRQLRTVAERLGGRRDRRRRRAARRGAGATLHSSRRSRRATERRSPCAGRSRTCRTTCCRRSSASSGGDARLTLGGVAPEDRDFVHAVYGKFPYVLAFVIVLTFVLLMRAFRSIVLPLKAVILNLVSLAASFGIIVFIFQQGHGARRSGTCRRPTRSSPGSR